MIRKRIRHYEVQDELGRGGMGVVYRARDTRLKRDVAIKFLSQHVASSPAERKRFQIEAQAAASLTHPNIATIYAVEDVEDDVCIVMEYIDGVELKDHIAGRKLPIDEALHIGKQIAAGLQAAHTQGVVHRDIKGRNIMITPDGRVKIMDFGLAKVDAQTRITRTGTTVGTFAYMSPEQATGQDVDARTDIWSFGVMLYELLAGCLPFPGDHEAAVLYAVVNAPHGDVRSHRADIPEAVSRIIDRCLAKEPDNRYASADELIADLDRLSKSDRDSEEGTGTKPAVRAGSGRRTGARFIAVAAIIVVAVMAAIFGVGRLTSPPDGPTRSIAVLPFVNERENPDIEYLSDGITESLIGRLSPISDLRVLARSTVFRFKNTGADPIEVGKKLKVRAVLSGRLDYVGDRLVVGAELIDVASGAQLWGERYNRKMTDIFAIEKEISDSIAAKLRVKLDDDDPAALTRSPAIDAEAYQYYLQGRFYWNQRSRESMPTALAAFEKAVALAPDYAPAWAGIADCHTVGWGAYLDLSAREGRERAVAAVRKALALDDNLAEAHASYAMVELVEHRWDWQGGMRELRRAIELNPGYVSAHQWLGETLFITGRFDEAFDEIETALEIDPLSLIVHSVLGWAYLAARDGERALAQFDRTLEMEPDFADALHGRFYALILVGASETEVVDALYAVDRIIELGVRWEGGTLQEYWQARLDAMSTLDERTPLIFVLESYVQLGKTDQALDLLETMAERRDPSLTYINILTTCDPLRSEPRFQAVIHEMGLRPVEL